MGYVVVGRDSERVREERPAVSPHPGLARRRRHARNDQDRRHGAEQHAPLAPQGQDRRQAPRDRDEETHRRDVGVAVRHPLIAHLEQPDHGQQGEEVPEPADRDGRVPPRHERDDERDATERRRRPRHRRRGRWPEGIEDRQPAGPRRLQDVARRGDQGVGGPRAERGPSEVGHRAGAALGPEGDRAGTGGEREERRLLPRERREISSLAEATEWPGVEEKKHQGKRHHHRLRHEAEREAEKGHEIAPQCGLDGVALVGQEREHPAQAGEHVLPLRHPGYGLDVKRMDGKERGNERRRAERARHARQRREQRQRAARVDDDVGPVVTGRVEAEQLAVQHVRDPRERMPVGGVAGRHRPADVLEADAAPHVAVLAHVVGVVVVHELVEPRRGVDGENGGHEQDGEAAPEARRRAAGKVGARGRAGHWAHEVARPSSGRGRARTLVQGEGFDNRGGGARPKTSWVAKRTRACGVGITRRRRAAAGEASAAN